MSKSSLILGSASRLPAEHFLPFLRSLSATGYEGRVCIFVTQMDPSEAAKLAELADEVVPLDDAYPAVVPDLVVAGLRRVQTTRGVRRFYPDVYRWTGRALRAPAGSARARDLEYRLQGIQSHRYQHYLDYLATASDIGQVMITDLRDVLFQEDPFLQPCDELEVYLEEPHVTVSAPGFNSTWLRDLYGQAGVDDLGDAVVSCSGVTFGTRDGMTDYLRAMAREVDRHTIPLGPHDQAIHNWLLYTGQLPGARIIPNGSGRVQTMGAQREVYLSSDGRVVNPDGSLPAVIHQYDRHVGLATRLAEEFGSA